jgi:plasmid maintenance system antidote protein VapI
MKRFTPKIIAPPHSTLPLEVVMVESFDGEMVKHSDAQEMLDAMQTEINRLCNDNADLRETIRILEGDYGTLSNIAWELRVRAERAEENLAVMTTNRNERVEELRQAVASCKCRGTGKWETSCSLCGDSTFDHYCNDEIVDCDQAWCIAARKVISAYFG